MKTEKLKNMSKGWFVGNFIPTLYKTDTCEVAVKEYRAGDCEEMHYHKVATEITVVVSGRVMMFGQEFSAGDIVYLEPNDATDFKAITNAVTTVVKMPCVKGDKYLGRPND